MDVPTTMTAAVTMCHGGPDAIEIRREWPAPAMGPHDVTIRVTAAALNNTDIWAREGAYGTADDPDAVAGWKGVPLEFPRIQGIDVTGEVVGAGGSVGPSLLGRRVIVDPALHYDDGHPAHVLGSEADGGFAEFLVWPADRVHDVGGSALSDAQLACLPTAYGTALGMINRAACTADERVLVTGASGGVVDVVVDVVGGADFGALLDRLRTGGRMVTAGAIAGPVVPLDLRRLYLRQRRIIGSTMHTPDDFAELARAAVEGGVDPQVAEVFPLTELHAAQRRFVAGDFVGKLVVVPEG